MALNFPDSPTVGQVYTQGGRVWKWDGTSWILVPTSGGGGGSTGTVSPTPPTVHALGDRWIDSDLGAEYWWTGTAWVELGASAASAAGPPGPVGSTGSTGAAGAKGDIGDPGGVLLSGFWLYGTSTATPVTNGQVRTNIDRTQLYLAETDADGIGRGTAMSTVSVGDSVRVRSSNNNFFDATIGTPIVDGGSWRTYFITVVGSGTATKGLRSQVSFTKATPPPDPELSALGGLSSDADKLPYFTGVGTAALTDFTAYSRTLVAAPGSTTARAHLGAIIWGDSVVTATAGPPRRGVQGVTAAPFLPSIIGAHENKIMLMDFATAIDIIMPSSATALFNTGTEIDFMWYGAGQPTFVADSDVTLYSSLGLKMRARYSKASARKLTGTSWLIYGDLTT